MDCGLSGIYPSSLLDPHIFSPCGYSLNGLVGPHYWTVHVTPQQSCSFASFESDVSHSAYTDLVNQVGGGCAAVHQPAFAAVCVIRSAHTHTVSFSCARALSRTLSRARAHSLTLALPPPLPLWSLTVGTAPLGGLHLPPDCLHSHCLCQRNGGMRLFPVCTV